MEARETVMESGELCDKVKDCPCLDCGDCQLETQAEISFKAGIREVVEWIRNNEPDIYGSLMDWSIWQAKQKEWGIK